MKALLSSVLGRHRHPYSIRGAIAVGHCRLPFWDFSSIIPATNISHGWKRWRSTSSVASISIADDVAADDAIDDVIDPSAKCDTNNTSDSKHRHTEGPTTLRHTPSPPPSSQPPQSQPHDRSHPYRTEVNFHSLSVLTTPPTPPTNTNTNTITTTTTNNNSATMIPTQNASTTVSFSSHQYHNRHLSPEALRIPTLAQQPQSQPHSTSNMSDILSSYDQVLRERTSCHFGYPYNLQFAQYQQELLYPFTQYLINNLGDPYQASNYGVHSRPFEMAVIDYLAQLWHMDTTAGTMMTPTDHNNNNATNSNNNNSNNSSSYWGYVTASGTEGNLHGLLLARECFPDGILYTSQETHYSVFKAARYYRMECRVVPTLPNGEINYQILAAMIRRPQNDSTSSSSSNNNKPIILNLNIGTTVKGAIDNVDRIVQVLSDENIPRDQFYIHCDGALFALMIPFMTAKTVNGNHGTDTNGANENAKLPVISFATQPIDSIAVSGHKMLGCPMPCGVALCRAEHIARFQGQHIDYLNSIDTTIMGSRNGHAALYLWYALRTKGSRGLQQDVDKCIEMAQYLRHRLEQDVHVPCGLNAYSSTVVFERPVDVGLIQKWQLACSDDIAHIVVMPNITRSKIDQFINEFVATIETQGRIQPSSTHSPLAQLQSKLW